MKRNIILMLVLAFALSMFTACTMATVTSEEQEQNYESMFVIVEEAPNWLIVYHKTTRVMYAVSDGNYTYGNFTLLVDAEGNPLLWDGRSEENEQ